MFFKSTVYEFTNQQTKIQLQEPDCFGERDARDERQPHPFAVQLREEGPVPEHADGLQLIARSKLLHNAFRHSLNKWRAHDVFHDGPPMLRMLGK